MRDQLITVSGALEFCFGMSSMQEHETDERNQTVSTVVEPH